jgi:hypothetical protein
MNGVDLSGQEALAAATGLQPAFLIRIGIHPSRCHCEHCDHQRNERLLQDLERQYGPTAAKEESR